MIALVCVNEMNSPVSSKIGSLICIVKLGYNEQLWTGQIRSV